MERYLLFDSGCIKCTNIAKSIEHETRGWLSVRSLRDPAIQMLLDGAYPSWSWEPVLIEISGDEILKYSGVKMGFKMLRELGAFRSYKISQIIYKHGAQQRKKLISSGHNNGRRAFLKNSSVMLGSLALFPIGRSFSNAIDAVSTENIPPNILDSLKNEEGVRNGEYKEIIGREAQNRISQALGFGATQQLLDRQAKLSIEFDATKAKVFDLVWEDNVGVGHAGHAVCIPLGKESQAGILIYGEVDGKKEAIAVNIPAPETEDAYVTLSFIQQGEISIVKTLLGGKTRPQSHFSTFPMSRLSGKARMAPSCTTSCFGGCLRGYGVNAMSVSLCIATLVACPFTWPSCGLSLVCTGVAGYAMANCTNYCCPG